MTRFVALLLAGLVLAACPAARADDSNCAMLKPTAERGGSRGQYLYAQALDAGTCGFKVDKKEAERWYRKAAVQGDMLAAYELAETFFDGDGFATDYPEAKKWYLKAAAQGHGPSQLRLGFLYAEKHFKGLTVDYAQAEKWFTKAAAQSAGDAQFRLGNFYINYKRPPDYARGMPWLKKAAEGGNRTAMFDLGRLQLAGTGVPKDTAAGIGWIKKSAEAGTLQAQMTLAKIYAEGKEAPKDVAEALKWTLKIADAPTAAPFYLVRAGDIFFDGWETIPKDYAAARKYYERAALRGNAHALERLALIYREGLGVEKDEKKAKEFEERTHH
ncbi:MAG: tetratricopeptide repeat protein [Alphaproteobacteria bacterium]